MSRDQAARQPKKGQIRRNLKNSLLNSLLAGNCGRRKHKRCPQLDLPARVFRTPAKITQSVVADCPAVDHDANARKPWQLFLPLLPLS